MAERNIGLVKQVIRCLQLDRQLQKGSWPKLLTEVTFHINGMINATSRISPHMLTFGREPQSPLDSWCHHLGESQINSHGEHLTSLKKKQVELREIAMDNIRENLSRARRRYNQGKAESPICQGDVVMLRRNTISDGLTEKFNGPYEVLGRRGPDVKVRLNRRDRWIHIDNVKKYVRNTPGLIQIEESLADGSQEIPEERIHGGRATEDFNLPKLEQFESLSETNLHETPEVEELPEHTEMGETEGHIEMEAAVQSRTRSETGNVRNTWKTI